MYNQAQIENPRCQPWAFGLPHVDSDHSMRCDYAGYFSFADSSKPSGFGMECPSGQRK